VLAGDGEPFGVFGHYKGAVGCHVGGCVGVVCRLRGTETESESRFLNVFRCLRLGQMTLRFSFEL